ncbi:MAG: TIGR03960 family B12-binding radical SAM protein [Deltaproteobacteria bacterium]|nr:TIGR03960 family B12-binding radical SAM protein [Deltaproteobacteria bacterium]
MSKYDDFFMSVSKPIRYIGGEVNQIKKDPSKTKIKFALCFPDIYEIGMNHTGGKIIYKILNEEEDILCERVFAPWVDAKEEMKKRELRLFSLENRIPINQFDIIGFSIHYEMSFSTVIEMLKLGGIELFSRNRDNSMPLLIAGGPTVFNPEPLAEIFDLFYIGDAELNLVNIIRTYRMLKEKKKKKMDILEELSNIEGVYVPLLFDVRYDGLYLRSEPVRRINKAITPYLKSEHYPETQIVPFVETIQDRFVVEIQRGCTHGCRFCYAGYIYRPVRQRNGLDIIDIVTKGIKRCGFQEVSFLSLSVGDYTGLDQILRILNDRFYPNKISLSLPSFRVDTTSKEIMHQISMVKKTGITIAPEAGSEVMRRKINKRITEEDIINSVDVAFSCGWDLIKLYFMIGMPDEVDEDIYSICELSFKILDTAKKYVKYPKINITISPFVPKPHTPLQWECMADEINLKRKFDVIKRGLDHPAFNLKKMNIPLAKIEALLSRGDRRILDIILEANNRGAYLDAWADNFDISSYVESEYNFRERYGLSISDYLGDRDKKRPLPWDMISIGVSKEFLINENEKYHKGILTENCLTGVCSNCGVCDLNTRNVLANALDKSNSKSATKESSIFEDKKTYYRIQYSKEEDIVYASHLDMINIFTKALLMSGLPISFKGKFSPRVELSFGPALPVGIISTTEFMDFALRKSLPNDLVSVLLSRFLPKGIRIINIVSSQQKMTSIHKLIAAVRFDVYANLLPDKKSIDDVLNSSELKILRVRNEGSKEVNIRGFIHNIERHNNHIDITLLYKEEGTANIYEVLGLLGVEKKGDVLIRKDKVYFLGDTL